MEHAVGTFERLLHTHYLFYTLDNTQKVDIQCAGITNNTKQ